MSDGIEHFEAAGLTTRVDFIAGVEQPIVDHVLFRLSNGGDENLFVRVASLAFHVGEDKRTIDSFFVYDSLSNEALDPAAIALAGREERTIRIAFRSFIFRPRWGQRVFIAAEFETGSQSLAAVSELEVIEERPL